MKNMFKQSIIKISSMALYKHKRKHASTKFQTDTNARLLFIRDLVLIAVNNIGAGFLFYAIADLGNAILALLIGALTIVLNKFVTVITINIMLSKFLKRITNHYQAAKFV